MADSKIVQFDRAAAVVTTQGTMQDRLGNWAQSVTNQLNQNIAGSGSPEGVTDSRRFALYIDVDTDDVYIKTTEQGTLTGWKSL